MGNRSIATYTNLDPGVYSFRVKACNNDGVWNEDGISLEIKILPPWWQTWWARTIAVLIVIGMAVTYYRYKTYKLKKNQELLEKKVKERTLEVEKQAREINTQNEELKEKANEINVNII